ncbi:MAG: hypothetical protein JWM92_145 [Candidatus Nomurabacteria bacterium]|jgi:hypothetical protein|nr:hypothetical protein [Candidatus Nomurabacteria bacterium]
MKNLSYQQKKLLRKAGIILLGILCFISIVGLIRSITTLHRAGELQPTYVLHGPVIHHPVTVDTITPWMTFDYLNLVFRLPSTYLQNTLAITDAQYPNVTINAYARRHHINRMLLLQNVKQAITSYSAVNK